MVHGKIHKCFKHLKFENFSNYRQKMILQRLIPIITLVSSKEFDRGAVPEWTQDIEAPTQNDVDLLTECPWVLHRVGLYEWTYGPSWYRVEPKLSVPYKRKWFRKTDEKFRVPELNLVCTERCEQTLLECFVGCENDMNCVSDCIREETKCIQGKSL